MLTCWKITLNQMEDALASMHDKAHPDLDNSDADERNSNYSETPPTEVLAACGLHHQLYVQTKKSLGG